MHITCDLPGGGGTEPLSPPLDPHMAMLGIIDASMTFRRKPFRRMRLSVESDITSNATIRRIFVERQLVKWTTVEISSKIRRNLVEK